MLDADCREGANAFPCSRSHLNNVAAHKEETFKPYKRQDDAGRLLAHALRKFAVFLIFYLEPQARPFSYCLLYTSPSPRDVEESRMPSSA